MSLVAVILGSLGAEEAVKLGRKTADTGESVADDAVFGAALRLVGDMSQQTAAAFFIHGAGVLHAVVRGRDNTFNYAECIAFQNLDYFYLGDIAHSGTGDENSHAVNSADAASLGCKTCYLGCTDLIFFRHSVTSSFFSMSLSKLLMYSYGNL